MATERVDLVDGPAVRDRPEMATLGIREVVPFRTMLAERDRLLTELITWLRVHDATISGPFFLRLHVVDMAGAMDIEVGVVGTADPDDDRVKRGFIPAGRYAELDYRATSLSANRVLLAWASEQGLTIDSWATPHGDQFAARCEIYVTDPRLEPRKKRWVVRLALLLRPEDAE